MNEAFKKMIFEPKYDSFYEGIDFVLGWLETIGADTSEAEKALRFCEDKYADKAMEIARRDAGR